MKNFTIFLYRFAITIILYQLTGCATTTTSTALPATSGTDPNAVYRYDLPITVNGVVYNGVGVVPKAPSYTITITSSVDIDLFTIASCHRDVSADSVINVNWLHPKRSYSYTYTPVAGIEDVGSCLFRVGAYNKGSGASSFGVLDFNTIAEILPAVNQCNGVTVNSVGVSACQSRAGLLEIIIFPTPVQQAATALASNCKLTSKDGLVWQYAMPQGECVMAFKEVNGSRIHRLTTFGFTDILIKGD